MASRNQNKPPPRTPLTKISNQDDGPNDKRRKVTTGRIMGSTAASRRRQATAVVSNRQDAAVGGNAESVNEELESVKVEFTKEEVDVLINEKIRAKKFDLKGKMEQMNELINKLKLCIKWFQSNEEEHIQELEKLKSLLESAESRCTETETAMKNKEEELNKVIAELKQNIALLQNKLAEQESLKLDAINAHKREKEAMEELEKVHASLIEEHQRAKHEIMDVNQKFASVNADHKRLQEYNKSLQHYNRQLQADVATANDSVKRIEKEKSAIVENLSTLRGHHNLLQEQLTSSKALQDEAIKKKESLGSEIVILRGELQQVREDRDRQLSHVEELNATVAKYKDTTGKSFAMLDDLTSKSNALEERCSSQTEQIQILQHQLAAANEKLKITDLSTSEIRAEFEKKNRVVSELQERLREAELQIADGENLRKKLHNTILELKGNIRVFCRVRPLLPDDSHGTDPAVAFPTSGELVGRGIDLIQSGQKYPFTFDKVFSYDASQQDVFVEISQLVQSALDGYKVCVFAYGQTGSGKTFTMMGRPEAPEQKGLIPRSLEQIFQTSQALKTQGWRFKMQASMLEIYNETIRDLLSPRSTSSDIIRTENGGSGKQYAIRHDANGNTYVSDLTIVDVCSINEVSSLLQQAAQSRSVGKTDMNEQSSRSHFVFTLRIYGTNESTEQQVQGVLNLIDLAGSERLARSGATGDRLKETQAINKSLSCLSDVIFALAKKEDHAPFRNSKLTYLLQPCLGGNSKTLMFVNISPDPSSTNESLCSLRFAARVNSCEIGIPRRQTIRPLESSRLSCG
ncbi:kinesin-like protein KIN-14C [Apium graveolens]|uniref:kinesin-like protein KIN-14C n=1 Tax=Apium graveolens TaxID=4045 RepID=UPI003D7B3076